MLQIGTDEAGYGPLLGPLVIAAAAFESGAERDSLQDPAVMDSKRLYARGGRAALARALEPYLGLPAPVTLAAALARLSIRGDPRAAYPWYGDVADPVPRPRPPPDAFRGLTVSPICERDFNEGCAREGGKGTLLSRETLRLVRRALLDHPTGPARVVCDRHGGRKRYAALLMEEFSPSLLMELRETREVSAYRLHAHGREITIEFRCRAESTDPPVALASVAAKYVRELFMQALNEYFSARIERLRPTAGYHGDGQRFLADVEPILRHLEGGARLLTRTR
ncbi:MAG: hypothetical protein ACT4PV_02050 [Planctomycetaceae bacterium]